MSKRSRIKAGITVAVALLIAAIVVTVVYLRLPPVNPRAGNPLSSSEDQRYAEMVSAFYTGIAALDVDARDRARTSLTRATELYPEEPAAWADLGLLDLRTGDLDTAAREIERAKTLAPENGAIEGLLGHFAGLRGEYAEAVSHFRRATTLNPDDLRSRNSLIHEVERLGEPSSDTEALALAGELVAKAPQNIVALLERARLAVKSGDREALSDSVARLGELAQSWPANAQQYYRDFERETTAKSQTVARRVLQLRNVLLPTPEFRKDLSALETPLAMVGEPITTFLKLPPPPPTPAPADVALSYAINPVEQISTGGSDAVVAAALAPGFSRPSLQRTRAACGVWALVPAPSVHSPAVARPRRRTASSQWIGTRITAWISSWRARAV